MNIKHLGIFAVLGCIAMVGDGMAAGRSSMYSNINMRNSGGNTIRINRGVETTYSGDYGYTSRSNRSASYGNNTGATQQRSYQRYERVQETEKAEPVTKHTYTAGQSTYTKTARRKYFIANPFYQPLQGQFGSVTTGEYMEGNYNFALTSSSSVLDGHKAKRELREWSIKEDLSFGLTDRIALQGMIKYTDTKNKWKWDDSSVSDDIYKSHKIDLYGFGIQGRIVDTDEWIMNLSGYYEHQRDGIDYFIADFKAGYKVARTTIYGLVRGWLVNMEGDVYGDYMSNKDVNQWGMLIYGDAKDNLFMSELGAGVWSVLAEDWTLNVEGLYGFYDWHNQLSIKGAFGWQPNDYFALNLYAKTSLYDTADDKHSDMYRQGVLPLTGDSWGSADVADVEISKYHEWSVGLQVMFQF